MRHEGEISTMCNISASDQSCATLVSKIGEYGHWACKDIKPQRYKTAKIIFGNCDRPSGFTDNSILDP